MRRQSSSAPPRLLLHTNRLQTLTSSPSIQCIFLHCRSTGQPTAGPPVRYMHSRSKIDCSKLQVPLAHIVDLKHQEPPSDYKDYKLDSHTSVAIHHTFTELALHSQTPMNTKLVLLNSLRANRNQQSNRNQQIGLMFQNVQYCAISTFSRMMQLI